MTLKPKKKKRVAKKKRKPLKFQIGVQVSTYSMIGLQEYMEEKTGNTYIITSNCNQDPLERVFGYMRSKGGGLHDHPSLLELTQRIRASIVGKQHN